MSCIITYKGNKYTQEQFKEYISNNKNEFSHIIASNKNVINSFKKRMEDIDFVFSQSPELAPIGSKAQYLQYLSTIFKTSKVKDIVYHGSDTKFEDFLEDNLNYFGTQTIAKGYGKNLYPVVIEINKPYYEDGGNLSNQSYEDLYDKLEESGSDGFISNSKNLFVPKTEEQIHILGSKQDIEGFKKFISDDVVFRRDLSFQDLLELDNSDLLDTTTEVANSKRSQAIELADKMSNALGIEYSIITKEEAKSITEKASNQWAGERVFFYGNKVYFVTDDLTSDMVFHEFAHPFVRAISNQNETLFDNLYDSLTKTEEGAVLIARVKEVYPELDVNSKFFKEEVIVHALEKEGREMISKAQPESKFAKFINNLLYQVKQLLRKVFGQNISISKLDTNTSLNELAKILSTGNKIQIETQVITEEEYVAYKRDFAKEIAEDLTEIKSFDVQKIIDSFSKKVTDHVNLLLKNKNYNELADLLTDEYSRGDLQAMKHNLKAWESKVTNLAETFLDEYAESESRVLALSNTFNRLESIAEKIKLHVTDIADTEETQLNLNRAYYYDKFINHWLSFMDEFDTVLEDNGVSGRSAIRETVTAIRTDFNSAKSTIDKIWQKGARDSLYETLLPMKESLMRKYEERIKNLKDKNAPQWKIDDVYKEYHGMTENEHSIFEQLLEIKNPTFEQQQQLAYLGQKSKKGLSISKEKIELLLKGQIGDANYFNSYLEGYLYNTDPVIGGLALYVKNHLNEVLTKANDKMNLFAEDIRQALTDAGINDSNLGMVGRNTTFEDKVARFNKETGQIEVVKVHTFLNEHKDWRYDLYVEQKKVDDARDKYLSDNTKESQEAFSKAQKDFDEYLRTYFNQEYVPEYYKTREIFNRPGGIKAMAVRDALFNKIRLLQETDVHPEDKDVITEELKLAWREYAQLHSLYDLNGNSKTGIELTIAQLLREYRDATSEFYERRLRKGVFEKAYFDYLDTLRAEKVEENEDEWNTRVEQWLHQNTRRVIKPKWYDKRKNAIDYIDKLLSKLPESERRKANQSELWKQIFDYTAGFRGDDGAIVTSDIEPDVLLKIKKIQEDLLDMRENAPYLNGLTADEHTEFKSLEKKRTRTDVQQARFNILKNKIAKHGLSKTEKQILHSLFDELSLMSDSEPSDEYLDIVNNWLSKIVDEKSPFFKHTKRLTIDKNSAHLMLDSKIVSSLLKNAEFKEWYDKNHVAKKTYNPLLKKNIVTKYQRLYVWSLTVPTDEDMMEQFEIVDPNTGKSHRKINGLPANEYYVRVVKDEYKTRNIPGVTKDNRGNFLPKSKEEMSKNTSLSDKDKYRYINEDYEALKVKNPAMFTLLEKLKKHHLANQEGLSYHSKLYYDIPRYRKAELELVRSLNPNDAKETLTTFSQRFKQFFKGGEDDFETGLRNWEQRRQYVNIDLFDNEMTDIPISGISNLNSDDVSMDVTTSMLRYMLSAERQKQLVKISPVVRAIQNVVNKNAKKGIADFDKVNKRSWLARNLSFIPKDENIRAKYVNAFIAREFEGKTQAGVGKDNAFVHNFTDLLFKRASFSFFALNIPSALKNSMGMKFQAMLEGVAGANVSIPNLTKGNVLAYKAMSELSFSGELYNRGTRSFLMQMIDQFDMNQGKTEEKFGQHISRSVLKDVASMSWLYSPRKWVEMQANLQLTFGLLYHTKVKQRQEDGSEKEIDYVDAFEMVDGLIKLKPGIDVRYGFHPTEHVVTVNDTLESIAEKYNTDIETIRTSLHGRSLQDILNKAKYIEALRKEKLSDIDQSSTDLRTIDKINSINKKYDDMLKDNVIRIDNSQFNFVKNKMHQISNDMGGAYAKFDQPDAHRYLFYRFLSYMRRYLTTMLMKRWAFSGSFKDPQPRFNAGLGDGQMGYYIQFIKTLAQTIQRRGDNLQYMSPEEKAAGLRFLTEIASLYLMLILGSILFGFDDDDDDRYKKLRQESGAMGFFGLTSPEAGRDFNVFGFLELHALHLLLQTNAENAQFNPLVGGLKQYNSMLDIKSVALGPTTDAYMQILDDIGKSLTDDPKANYTRRVGPYDWQQKESAKIWNHLLKSFGLTGTSLDPALAIQNFEAYQSKVRR